MNEEDPDMAKDNEQQPEPQPEQPAQPAPKQPDEQPDEQPDPDAPVSPADDQERRIKRAEEQLEADEG